MLACATRSRHPHRYHRPHQRRYGVAHERAISPFTWLNFNPTLSEDWRDQDLLDDETRSLRSERFSTRATLTQTLYGLFNPKLGPLQALRHVLKPSLSLNYQASRSDTGRRLRHRRRLQIRSINSVNSISASTILSGLILRDEEESKVRLAQLNFSTSYDFAKDQRQLADLRTSMSIEAGRYLNSRLTLRNEFYDDTAQLQFFSPRLRQFEVRTAANWTRRAKQEEGWR